MGQVDHHAQGIHFGHNLPAERAQSAPFPAFCGTVGHGIVSVMGQRHITDAEPVKCTEEGQGFLDGRSVFHPHENGKEAVGLVTGRFGRGKSQRSIVRILIYGIIDCRKHLQGIARSRIRSHFRGRIKGKERTIDSPAPEFGKIHVGIGIVNAQIPEPHQLGGGIYMRIVHTFYLAVEP